MWRFKTLEEFEEEGLMDIGFGKSYPRCFNDEGKMDYLFGTDIPEKYYNYCNNSKTFDIFESSGRSWYIQSYHYTNKPLIGKDLIYEIY